MVFGRQVTAARLYTANEDRAAVEQVSVNNDGEADQLLDEDSDSAHGCSMATEATISALPLEVETRAWQEGDAWPGVQQSGMGGTDWFDLDGAWQQPYPMLTDRQQSR